MTGLPGHRAIASPPGGAQRPHEPGKIRDRALVLPLAGFALVMPPMAGIFQLDLKIAGVPFTLIYLFAVWAGLIAGSWRLSRHLGRAEAAGPQGPEAPAAEPAQGSGA